MSSALAKIERFLAERPFERMPWLAVAMLAGIGAWFVLAGPGEWLVLIGLCGLAAGMAAAWWQGEETAIARAAFSGLAVILAAGCLLAWARSELVGTPPIGGPVVAQIQGRILEREELPARDRVRLIIATHDPREQRTIRARINVSLEKDRAFLREGALIGVRARLIPPTHPVLPGAHDFARTAWFEGIAATGSALDEPELLEAPPAGDSGGLARLRRSLAAHVRSRVAGDVASAGGEGEDPAAAIAATLASGDRGAIGETDAQAMRDAGLAHLLSISGLHVGAVVGIVWFAVMKIFGLSQFLALRLRLPLCAAVAGAAAAIGYTLLTGAALPTVRACIAALLVLAALAIGRQALSMRLVALAAITVMLFWPEAVVGASFQLSFAAVVAIVALHNSAPMRRLLGRGEGKESRGTRLLRAGAALLVTGLVVEATLAPLVLFHFHRSGIYGAFANLLAIPLTTLVIMPALGLALLLDLAGIGAPAWWVTRGALDLLVGIARFASGQEGSVLLLPTPPFWAVLAFLAGFFWMALWSGRIRLYGLLPLAAAALGYALSPAPDLMIAAEGRHVALADEDGQIYLLRDRAGYTRDALLEYSGKQTGTSPDALTLTDWPGARCNRDFCFLTSRGKGLLISRRRADVDYPALIAACRASDIVIAERKLPADCRPRMLKADRALLTRRSGMTVDLETGATRYARTPDDRHGWR